MIGMLKDVDHGTYHAANFSERYAGYPESGFQPCDTPVLDLSSKHTALTTRVHITPCCHLSDFEGNFSGKKQPGPKVYLCDVLICSEKSGSIPNVCCCWFHCQMFPSFLADFLRIPRAIPSPSRSSCGSADGQSSAMPSGSTVPHRVSNRMKISRTRMS